MKRTVVVLALLLASSAIAQSASPHGIRVACTGLAGATFNLYRSTTSGAEQSAPPIASKLSSCTYDDTTAVIGTKYFYQMTQTVAGSIESGPSTPEVSAQIMQSSAPTNPSATVF